MSHQSCERVSGRVEALPNTSVFQTVLLVSLLSMTIQLSHSLVYIAVEPLIADPLVGFRKLQQVSESHTNPLPHTTVRGCANAWAAGIPLMCVSVLWLALRCRYVILLHLWCRHFASWCSHSASLPCRRGLWTTLWRWACQQCIDNIIIKEETVLLTDTSRLEITKHVSLQMLSHKLRRQFGTQFWPHTFVNMVK